MKFFKYAQNGDSLLFSFWNKLDRMLSGINKQKGRIAVIESHSIKVWRSARVPIVIIFITIVTQMCDFSEQFSWISSVVATGYKLKNFESQNLTKVGQRRS